MDNVHGCQLSSTYRSMERITADLGFSDRLRLVTRRLAARLRRALGMASAAPRAGGTGRAPGSGTGAGAPQEPLQPGDLVRARPLEEIQSMLVNGQTQGLEFLPGMARYCGTSLRVMKRVRYFFDERGWKMRKCNAVLLEGGICDGRDMRDKEGCDRSCYFFWRDSWLEKVQDGDQARR